MNIIPVSNLELNMIVADDVFSKTHQLLVPKGSIVTKQIISQLRFYNIDSIRIIEGDLPQSVKDAIMHKEHIENTHIEKLINSKEFQVFQAKYSDAIDVVKTELNDIILKNGPVNQELLLNEVVTLFNLNQTAYDLLGTLHSTHKIDDSTYAHSLNVAMISRLLGSWLGIKENDLNILTLAGLLHDIGKCKIPSGILLKPGKLTDNEFEIIKQHPIFGYEALSTKKLDSRIVNAALMHHERYDGSGYPSKLKGKEIDEFASIISIADVYDAMTQNRVYRSGMCPFEVIANFEEHGLQKYNTKFILVFLERIANSYINCEVLLSNNEIGRIIYLNQNLTRPIIQLTDGSILNLEDHLDLYIHAIV
ncbi:HD-GYP domain-containing protein [Lachnobacterium bovis]|uniref:HDIG domain-containing protein n=1 Tax=Lachnobacterium bovis TaxID=140626 RepID=A0A1H9Q7M6_9FIRM|nr:HD-GYP domain-containing protein [Lachnobacterium bovis]SER56444.1 HDIG domain-containing protein [Lachnobacterium bovis]